MYFIYPTLFLEYIEMRLSGPFRFEGNLSISIPVYGENSMYRTTLKTHVFPGTLKIGLIAAVLVLVCIAPVFASTAAEPAVGWKFHGELNNTGQYDDGGYHPIAKELWNITSDSKPTSGIDLVVDSPAVVNGMVYFGDRANHLFAVYANNGTIKWRNVLTDQVFSSPAVANGMVFVGVGEGWSTPGTFYAFNASTGGAGIPVWKKDTKHGTIAGGFDASPTVAYGNVYVGRDDYNVSAWNVTTGADVWRFQTSGGVWCSPAVANYVVYFTTEDGNVFAVNATTGKKIWDAQNATGWNGDFGGGSGSSPVLAYGKIYTAGHSGVFAFNASTGRQVDEFQDGSYFDNTPAVANNRVYIGTSSPASDALFYALNANDLQTVVWMNVTPDNTAISSSAAVANGRVYVISEDGNDQSTNGYLYVWNAATGAPVWNYGPGVSGDTSSPAVSNGVVYFGDWWHGFFAIGKQKPVPAPRPTVTGISPTTGSTAGGTVVTVTGTGFTGATTVKFGTVAGTSLTVNSSTKITIKSPAHAAGIVDVTVTTPGGTSAIVAGDKFTYGAPPKVTKILPATGPTTGNTLVTINGTGFTGATAVKFGTTAGTSKTVVSSTKITVRSPAHAAGSVDIRVTTPYGTSAIVTADKFTYMVT